MIFLFTQVPTDSRAFFFTFAFFSWLINWATVPPALDHFNWWPMSQFTVKLTRAISPTCPVYSRLPLSLSSSSFCLFFSSFFLLAFFFLLIWVALSLSLLRPAMSSLLLYLMCFSLLPLYCLLIISMLIALLISVFIYSGQQQNWVSSTHPVECTLSELIILSHEYTWLHKIASQVPCTHRKTWQLQWLFFLPLPQVKRLYWPLGQSEAKNYSTLDGDMRGEEKKTGEKTFFFSSSCKTNTRTKNIDQRVHRVD